MYEGGRGVAKDEAEAVKWYRQAAEEGDAGAMSNLGQQELLIDPKRLRKIVLHEPADQKGIQTCYAAESGLETIQNWAARRWPPTSPNA
jgi:TPR repeat protein